MTKSIRFEQNNITKGHLNTLTPGIAISLQDRYFLGATLSQVVGYIFTTSDTNIGSDTFFDESTTEQSARFLRLGAFAKLNPELTVGLMYRTEFVWILRDTITIRDKYGNRKTDSNQLHGERPIPDIWGIGAEYWVSPEFAVALEAQSRPLSKLEEFIIDNGFNVSVGGEYLGLGFPLRVGVFRDVIPKVDNNDTAPRSLIGVTAGIGSKDDSKFSWNASLLMSKWQRRMLTGHKYSENLLRIGIAGTYRFKK